VRLLYLIGQRHPRTGASGSTTADTAAVKDDTPAAATTRPAPAAAEDGIPATAEAPGHPAGMADESGRRILMIALACAVLAAAGVVSFALSRSSPTYQGGGVWVHPSAPVAEWGDGPMVIEVQVTNISQVEHIDFTGTWPGVGWEVLSGCAESVAPPYPAGDIYRCMFDPQAAGVPALTNMTF